MVLEVESYCFFWAFTCIDEGLIVYHLNWVINFPMGVANWWFFTLVVIQEQSSTNCWCV